jgi:hypothetical protein
MLASEYSKRWSGDRYSGLQLIARRLHGRNRPRRHAEGCSPISPENGEDLRVALACYGRKACGRAAPQAENILRIDGKTIPHQLRSAF